MINKIMASLVLTIILILVEIVTGSEFSDTGEGEIYRLLKKLNKPFLKSIKSRDGDIIDCVHMKNHPIYDNPLFKNHTIQMKPSSYPEGWNNKSSNTMKQNIVTQLWTINGKCPKNSIPIRRTRRRDLLRAESIERYGKKNKPTNSNNEPRHEYAIVEVKVKSHQPNLYGAKAVMNIWKPSIHSPREFSLAQMWVSSGSYNTELNTIEVGWQVYPEKYGNDNPRYFVYWTGDGYEKTGCYNLDCPGFIAINREFVLGGAINRVSNFGKHQEEMVTYIWKDHHSGHWWLKVGTHVIGYWHSSIFKGLRNGATEIDLGGEIVNFNDRSQHTTTHMGSGVFAENGLKKGSYFRNIEILDQKLIPKKHVSAYSIETAPGCYNVKTGTDKEWGFFFYYGGPGRNPKCN